MRHPVSILCRLETYDSRASDLSPFDSVTRIGLEHALCDSAIYVQKDGPHNRYVGLRLRRGSDAPAVESEPDDAERHRDRPGTRHQFVGKLYRYQHLHALQTADLRNLEGLPHR